MTLFDLIEKDILWIKAFYEEFYKDKKEHNLENFTDFLKEVFKQNVKKEYSICSMTVDEDWEAENYIFICGYNEYTSEQYALVISECSCGWDCCGESNWRTAKNLLEEKLGKFEVDFWYAEEE